MKKIVVLISGSGSNLQAILDYCANSSTAKVVAVISNKAGVGGLERAANAGVETHVIPHVQYSSRDSFDAELADTIDQYQPDLIVLAGFMRILTAGFVNRYLGRLVNIHPSLLPKYPGINTHQRAIENGDNYAGATVHFVTAELDGGPAIVQASVPILSDDTSASLAARVLTVEHQIYRQAVAWFVEERVVYLDNKAYFENRELPETGIIFEQI